MAVSERTVAYTFQLGDLELGPALGVGERAATRDEVRAGAARLAGYLTSRVRVTNAGAPCEPHPGGLELVERTGGFWAMVTIDYECKRTVAELAIAYDLFFELDPRHQGFATVALAGDTRDFVFRDTARTFELSRPVGLAQHLRDYFALGVEHIFTGYDHIAFLFGLLVVAGFASLKRGLKYVLGVVTAFTVAHSLTLIASGLGLVRLSPRIVEPAIALSILYVAVENLVGGAGAPFARRWLLTFGFGLVHGFGFASILRDVGLPPKGQVLSLLAFNVGVEAGQLAVVSLAAPLLFVLARARPGRRRLTVVEALVIAALSGVALLTLRRFALPWPPLIAVCVVAPAALAIAAPLSSYDAAVRRAGSLVLAGLAAFWFLERILGVPWLGGTLG